MANPKYKLKNGKTRTPEEHRKMSKKYVISVNTENDLNDEQVARFITNYINKNSVNLTIEKVELYVPSSYGGYGTREIE